MIFLITQSINSNRTTCKSIKGAYPYGLNECWRSHINQRLLFFAYSSQETTQSERSANFLRYRWTRTESGSILVAAFGDRHRKSPKRPSRTMQRSRMPQRCRYRTTRGEFLDRYFVVDKFVVLIQIGIFYILWHHIPIHWGPHYRKLCHCHFLWSYFFVIT